MKHLILIGLPGSGKTTVGRLLAQKLSMPFADCDTCLEQQLGRTIPEIFAEEGESYFRREESRMLQTLCRQAPQVIATGGGAVLLVENRKLICESGLVVFLDRPPREIAEQVDGTGGPLLQNSSVEELSRCRRTLYLECARVSVCAQSAEAAAERIANYWRENRL